ncbi:Periplasmic solute binding protein [Candidatus Magnetobacterium bavaricum]|uniref:Periplasmic solute binding protein n=1 Tax=Candidatus Magnetobacterium bavaricum TaxID=29290 RepID=A0A0F3GVP6_9BACT|nr:Periplasmic solute binding protein [Candidatus Magnetobacterium bavaricum]
MFITRTVLLTVVLLLCYGLAMAEVQVAASFYPLAHFAGQVGGNLVQVTNVTPTGVEPHEFEPRPMDVKKAFASRLFVFNGGGIDPWAQKLQNDLQAKGVTVLCMACQLNKPDDPHFWIDPVLAIEEVRLIRDSLCRVDPQNESVYKKNAEAYIKKLTTLDANFREGLKTCKHREIVVTHNAFGYLAGRYNLKTLTLAGLSPIEEPSARKLGQISRVVKDKGIRHIFFESLVSPKIAQSIATETGAVTLPLNPCEGLTTDDVNGGRDYIAIMQDNLKNLRLALSCK